MTSAAVGADTEVAPVTAGTVSASGGATPTLVLASCCLSIFMVGLDITVVNAGLPAMGRSMGASVAGLQWAVAAYTIPLASLLMFSGALADRFGRRMVFQVGLAVFILGSWLCSLAPDLGWLIGFRILQGVGGSMLNPAALGIVVNTFASPAGRARAMGAWDATVGLSMALGPLVGGLLVGSAGWRSLFWVNIPVGLAGIAATAVIVPESRAAIARRADPFAQVLVIAMIGVLTYAIIQAPSFGWRSPWTLGLFAASAAAAAALVMWEQGRAGPLIDFRVFRHAPFTGAVACAVWVMVAQSAFLFLSTLYLQDVRGFSALRAGLAILPMPAAMAAMSPVAGMIVAKRGPHGPLMAAGAAVTLASAMLAWNTPVTSLGFLAVLYALFGAGIGTGSPAITNAVTSGIPRHQGSLAAGLHSSSRQLGQVLGVAVAGSILASSLRGGMDHGFLAAARPDWWVTAGCAYLIMALAVVVLRPRRSGIAVRYEPPAAMPASVPAPMPPAVPPPAAMPPGSAPRTRNGAGLRRGRHAARRGGIRCPAPRGPLTWPLGAPVADGAFEVSEDDDFTADDPYAGFLDGTDGPLSDQEIPPEELPSVDWRPAALLETESAET